MVSARFLYTSCLLGTTAVSSAFQSNHALAARSLAAQKSRTTSSLSNSASDVEEYLAANYPSASNLLSRNGDAMKKILKSELGFTIFAPNEAAFNDMGEKKLEQLGDIRNDEMAEKISLYHVIDEPVTADQLFNSGGVVTEGGEVPAERSVSGGFFGVGGQEDGGVTLSGAKVVQSLEFSDATTTGIIHEVDGLISPSVLWRYADQLRIPGST